MDGDYRIMVAWKYESFILIPLDALLFLFWISISVADIPSVAGSRLRFHQCQL
jgi:hypothetical protein